MNPEKEIKPWLVYIEGQETYLDNISYLNLLLQRSEDAIRHFDHRHMSFIMYDLEEIREQNSLFYSLYKLIIDSEISSLKRLCSTNIISYDEYKSTMSNRVINSSSNFGI